MNDTPAPTGFAALPTRERRNGQVRPTPGTRTGLVWDYADAILAQRIAANEPHPVPVIMEVRKLYDANPGAMAATCQTQYGRWLQFHDAREALKARRESEKGAMTEAQLAKEAAKEAKKAEREAKVAGKAAKSGEREAAKKAKEEAAAAKAAAKVEKDAQKAIEKELKAQAAAEKKAAAELLKAEAAAKAKSDAAEAAKKVQADAAEAAKAAKAAAKEAKAADAA